MDAGITSLPPGVQHDYFSEAFVSESSREQQDLLLEIAELKEQIARLEKQNSDQSVLITDYSRFKTLVDEAEHGFAMFDLQGRITYINNHFALLHGYTPDELQAHSISVFHTEEQVRTVESISNTVCEHGKASNLETKHVRRNGSEFTVQMSTKLVNDKDGKPEYISASAADIDRWKLQQEASAMHFEFLKNLNLVDEALRKSATVDQMMSDVLQIVLELFDADRAWLLYPCDPNAEQWSIPMERTRPGYPGAEASGSKFPMTVEMKEFCREILRKGDIVTIDSRENSFLDSINSQFSILSQIIVLLNPQIGKPWILGLHQCSHFRKWSTADIDLFREISHRISDALRTMLLVRNLRESEEKFRYLSDTSMEAIFFTRNGICLEANQMAAKMFGWESPSEFIGKAGSEIVAPENWEMVKANLLSEFPEPYEAVGIRRNGSRFPVIIHTRSILYKNQYSVLAVSVMDISRQRETEDLLRMTRERAEKYLNLASAVFVALDTQGVVTLVNKKACEVLKRRENDIVGKNWFGNFLPASIGKQMKEVFQKIISGQLEEVEYFENPVISGDGSERLIAWHNAVITDSSGKITGLLSSGQDITIYRKAAQERRDLERQMQHAQKLESLGILAGGIAHDFNNILTAILGNINIALMDLSPKNPVYGNIKAMETATRRAADLAKQMLAYSGRGKFIIEPLSLNEAVNEMTHILEVSISKNTRIEYYHADNLPQIEADTTQIRQIIMNLVTNASDAIEGSSGTISITTGTMYCDEDYFANTYIHETLVPGHYVFLEVSDTGCGMDRETLKKLFDPFFTTKFTGRGLGLSAVLGIIRGHRGAIKVYSEPGTGTTIKVLFPVTAFEQKKHIRTTQNTHHSWTGSGTILLVDDEETILSVGKQMLEHLGFDVVTAPNGMEAVRVFSKLSNKITLVILDYIMPHLDGKETLRELRKIKEKVQVIMCSGYNEQEVTRTFKGKPPAGFLHKPYIFKELASVLQRLIDNYMKQNDTK
jgi:PAS domain S-box-containing protein